MKPATSVLCPTSRLPSRVIVLTAPGGMPFLGQAVDHRHDPFLVRDRDVGAEEVVAAQLADGVGQLDRRPVPQLVGRIDAELVEGGLLHRPGQRMGYRMPDEDDALRHAPILSSSPKNPG